MHNPAKAIAAILLANVFLLQSFNKELIHAAFTLNEKFISEVLCINKNEPELNCHGKCYLNDQLEKEKEKEQDPLAGSVDKSELQLFSGQSFVNIMIEFNGRLYKHCPCIYRLHEGLHSSVFHPPSA
ncbi:MAG: hypothetical protein DWQ44_04175 [Bacteroidetes bacterium]|nr:MAG: hypothetical protein DWQ33_02245 [Bacteroidota bacterium]REK03783.1 MAG: hypothetical protein DWQ39_09015 [Bacteroidota bacterium]REK35439.1 MAG: hypothetical protein DWQ44_04175 [Bacteroidota bacterium]REK51564.1 MAG: hypothetical protein DWQ48_00860 [Bacteroidota bacterium]